MLSHFAVAVGILRFVAQWEHSVPTRCTLEWLTVVLRAVAELDVTLFRDDVAGQQVKEKERHRDTERGNTLCWRRVCFGVGWLQ